MLEFVGPVYNRSSADYLPNFYIKKIRGNMWQADMENVPSKPNAAWEIFFGSGKFLVGTYKLFLLQIVKIFFIML